MCGIACFLSNTSWQQPTDLGWLEELSGRLVPEGGEQPEWESVASALEELAARFDDLMAFGTHCQVVLDAGARGRFVALAAGLRALAERAAAELAEEGVREDLERLHERLEDYLWQVEVEVLQNAEQTSALLPEPLQQGGAERPHHFLAWSVEQVLQSVDKLEVRGRDSAGVSIACVLAAGARGLEDLGDESRRELDERRARGAESADQVLVHDLEDGRSVVRFVYKVANLVGSLGDNCAALRRAVRSDPILWRLAPELETVNVMAHTRWASNGIINIPNSHPVDARGLTHPGRSDGAPGDEDALFVLNGDVDNYRTLVETTVAARGTSIDPAISTDAKILPLFFHLDTDPGAAPTQRFRATLQRCQGSLAVVMQHPDRPHRLWLGQKGSGQSLFVGEMADGWTVASELYGLAARCRRAAALATADRGGLAVTLSTEPGGPAEHRGGVRAVYLADGEPLTLKAEAIEIFSRDVDRKDFDYYIDKEIHEAPESIRKTLQGKYRKSAGGVTFTLSAFGNGPALLERLRSSEQPAVRRIVAVGQGTASIAAMGVAYLVRQAVEPSGVMVESAKASELFGFLPDRPLDDMLLIAISQSGTTTDTNRVVDLARDRGAWVHAIVNRRDSPLVHKADSYLYTSNGRDVEMSVASTKAFYSQVAAGKLMALLLADEWGCLEGDELARELAALESLPGKIEEVLARRTLIAELARELAPGSRYWAVVGNGANRIAAEEIRIKLSELCYKAIPCDITEDKKHIDLSTEPLTLVVANQLSEQVVQDTAKEVAIFKAHNGRPLVICSQGESRFDDVAERLIKVPRIGGSLGFILATAAGHVWGVEAAKAIDEGAAVFRDLRTAVTRALEHPGEWGRQALLDRLDRGLELIEEGRADSPLPARHAVALAAYARWLERQPPGLPVQAAGLDRALTILNAIVEEMTRSIDTIRHQAKTVTVGISRPRPEISPLLLDAFRALEVTPAGLKEKDRRLLETVSPLVSGVAGAILYQVAEAPGRKEGEVPRIQAVRATGTSQLESSRYRQAQAASGTKRKVLRTGSAAFGSGPRGEENLLILPLYRHSDWQCAYVLLAHLELVRQASLAQKLALLKQLGSKYDELLEQKEEQMLIPDLDELIEHLSPRDLIFRSIRELLKLAQQLESAPSSALAK